MGDFYTAAFDSTNADKLGISPLKPLLEQINNVKDVQSLVETMAVLKVKGSGSLFSYYVYADARNSNENIFYLGQGGYALPDRDYYFPTDDRGKNTCFLVLANFVTDQRSAGKIASAKTSPTQPLIYTSTKS